MALSGVISRGVATSQSSQAKVSEVGARWCSVQANVANVWSEVFK